jgi:uncharacterized protein
MKLKILDGIFSILKLSPSETIPSWVTNCDVFSLTRTEDDLSIVCPTECIPVHQNYEDIENDWKCIKVEGILDFGLTGILASLAAPLAEKKISIFAISTFNTDYLLVKSHCIQEAKLVLEHAGHSFSSNISNH